MPEDHMTGRPRHRFQPAAQLLDLASGEIPQQRVTIDRQFHGLAGSGTPQQIVLGPFDRTIDVREEAVAMEDVGQPRGGLGAAGQDQPEPDATRAERCVDFAENAGAGRIRSR